MSSTPDQGSPDSSAPPPSDQELPRPDTSRPEGTALSIPYGLLIILMVVAATIYFVQRPQFFDHQIGNMMTLVLGFLGVVSVLVWFGLQSSIPLALRLAVPGLLIASIATFFVFFRIEEVSGEMIPKFTYRFAPPSDAQLEPIAPAEIGVDLSATTPFDFPQFLGPNRDLKYDAVRLADWNGTSPELLWKLPCGAGWSGFAAVNGYAVTLEQRGDDELIVCYEIETGEVAWVHSHRWRHETILGGVGPRSTPTIEGGKVYAQGAGGMLFCLDGSTGDVIWQRDLLEDFEVSAEDDAVNIAWGRAGSPLIVAGKVIVPAGGPKGSATSLVAYDKLTGDELWRGGDSQISYASPAIATLGETRQVVIVNESTVAGHDLESGEQLWTHPWAGNSNADASASQAVALAGDRVLVSKGYNGGAALLTVGKADDQWTVESQWHESRLLKTKFSNVVIDQKVAFGLSDGILEAVDLSTGERLWKKGRYGHGQILLIGDKLLVLAESGTVHLLQPGGSKPTELGEFEAIEGKTWNNLCLYGEYLLVRNGAQMACFRLPLNQPNEAVAEPE